MQKQEPSRRIQILRDSVARKIAAGEVIDRPFSVVRELLDNSLDAGATHIEVHIDGGGVRGIRVVDDGFGMSPADLQLSILPHATSKISTDADIYRISSLGFRGEALASIAVCAKLEIVSKQIDQDEGAYRIVNHGGKVISFGQYPGNQGTAASVNDLFYALPARRKFLKSPSAETAQCSSILVEKALAFPGVELKFHTNGELKRFWPAGQRIERIASVFNQQIDRFFLQEHRSEFDSCSIHLVATKPDFYRRDRRLIQVFVNNRRVYEYGLIQAVLYGYGEYLPGGCFPAAFAFIDINPELVDFNVHPAKKEVRIKHMQEIHHCLVSSVKELLFEFTRRFPSDGEQLAPSVQQNISFEKSVFENTPSYSASPLSIEKNNDITTEISTATGQPRYLGQIFNLFLLAEAGERLYIIDQHAAHERILYDYFANQKPDSQHLLVPIELPLSQEEEDILQENASRYLELGITVEKKRPGQWQITACPEPCLAMLNELVEFVKQNRGTESELRQEMFATMSCRSAVKDGDPVDPVTAQELLKKVFALQNARCPHGRPIWHEISKAEIEHYVGRVP